MNGQYGIGVLHHFAPPPAFQGVVQLQDATLKRLLPGGDLGPVVVEAGRGRGQQLANAINALQGDHEFACVCRLDIRA